MSKSDESKFIAYIFSVFIITMLLVIFIIVNPQYFKSIISTILASLLLLTISIVLALVPMISSILLLTVSITIIVFFIKYWVSPIPTALETINRVLIASILELMLFIQLVFGSYARCVEVFLRTRRTRLLPSFRDLTNELRGFEVILGVEILELITIIAIYITLSPSVLEFLGEIRPGYGLKDLIEIYPIRIYIVAITASIGVILSIYDQLKYVDIIHNNLNRSCCEHYIENLQISANEKCVLKALIDVCSTYAQGRPIHFNNVYEQIHNQCVNIPVAYIRNYVIGLLSNPNIINDLVNNYPHIFCNCILMLCDMYHSQHITDLPPTLNINMNRCRIIYSSRYGICRSGGFLIYKLKMSKLISLLPFIILPIIIAAI